MKLRVPEGSGTETRADISHRAKESPKHTKSPISEEATLQTQYRGSNIAFISILLHKQCSLGTSRQKNWMQPLVHTELESCPWDVWVSAPAYSAGPGPAEKTVTLCFVPTASLCSAVEKVCPLHGPYCAWFHEWNSVAQLPPTWVPLGDVAGCWLGLGSWQDHNGELSAGHVWVEVE